MIRLAIRQEPNGKIYIDKEATKRFSDEELKKPPYNYAIINVDIEDCEPSDFDSDLTFNVQKYNNRKQNELNSARIEELKNNLRNTDYIALKAFEGSISEAEFEPTKKQREEWRKEVDALLKTI